MLQSALMGCPAEGAHARLVLPAFWVQAPLGALEVSRTAHVFDLVTDVLGPPPGFHASGVNSDGVQKLALLAAAVAVGLIVVKTKH